MREEQREQAAAQRCADLANALQPNYADAANFLRVPTTVAKVALNAVLQLDELARTVETFKGHLGLTAYGRDLLEKSERHILPEPKASPVERLAGSYRMVMTTDGLAGRLDELGLELREKSS